MIYNVHSEMLCEVAESSDILYKVVGFENSIEASNYLSTINDFPDFNHDEFYNFCIEINNYFENDICGISFNVQLNKSEILMLNYMRDF